ncbi:hypothetical protein EV424DRAFT_1594770 [Suillus variegatus]|nr:hypothetical protein EV424DRAFT_1594770 [Suillus variegatus]
MLARCLLAMTSDISKEHNGSANAHLSINITKVIIRTSPKLPAPSISNPQFMRCATRTWRDRSSSFLKMPMGLTHDQFDLPRHGSHYRSSVRAIRTLLSPPDIPTPALLCARSIPNQHLVKALGISSTFVSDDPGVHDNFTRKSESPNRRRQREKKRKS